MGPLFFPIAITAAVALGLYRSRATATHIASPVTEADPIRPGSVAIVDIRNLRDVDLATPAGGLAALGNMDAAAFRVDTITGSSYRGPLVAFRKKDGSFVKPSFSVPLVVHYAGVTEKYPPGSMLV